MVQRLEYSEAKIELGYWAIRGLAQPIRLLLNYLNIPFYEVRLGAYSDGTIMTDRSEESLDWKTHKQSVDFPFPNLPYLIDKSNCEEIRLTQSNAIMRYLGRKYELYGDNEVDKICIEMLQEEAYDFRNCIVKTAYVDHGEYPAALAEFEATAIPRYLDRFEVFLQGTNNCSHFVGARISFVHFILYELIWQTNLMLPGCISPTNRPCLNSFIQSFEKIPQISEYLQHSTFIRTPINSPWAAFT